MYTYLPTYLLGRSVSLPTYLSTYVPTGRSVPTRSVGWSVYLPTYLPTYLLTYISTYLLVQNDLGCYWLQFEGYFITQGKEIITLESYFTNNHNLAGENGRYCLFYCTCIGG